MKLSDTQIKYIADRFLGWKLPENFYPDGGISFKRYGNEGTPQQYRNNPTGTNLLVSEQAKEMIRYLVEGLPDD